MWSISYGICPEGKICCFPTPIVNKAYIDKDNEFDDNHQDEVDQNNDIVDDDQVGTV